MSDVARSGRRETLEARALGAIWSADGPLTAAQVAGRLGGELEAAVERVLESLHARKFLARHAADGTHHYEAAGPESNWAIAQAERLLGG